MKNKCGGKSSVQQLFPRGKGKAVIIMGKNLQGRIKKFEKRMGGAIKSVFIYLMRALWSLIFPQISFLTPIKTNLRDEKSYAGTRKVVSRERKMGIRIFLRIFSEEFWWISGK